MDDLIKELISDLEKMVELCGNKIEKIKDQDDLKPERKITMEYYHSGRLKAYESMLESIKMKMEGRGLKLPA